MLAAVLWMDSKGATCMSEWPRGGGYSSKMEVWTRVLAVGEGKFEFWKGYKRSGRIWLWPLCTGWRRTTFIFAQIILQITKPTKTPYPFHLPSEMHCLLVNLPKAMLCIEFLSSSLLARCCLSSISASQPLVQPLRRSLGGVALCDM